MDEQGKKTAVEGMLAVLEVMPEADGKAVRFIGELAGGWPKGRGAEAGAAKAGFGLSVMRGRWASGMRAICGCAPNMTTKMKADHRDNPMACGFNGGA